jgi:hypothetical protein
MGGLCRDDEGVTLRDAERRLDDRVRVAPELRRLEDRFVVHAGKLPAPAIRLPG